MENKEAIREAFNKVKEDIDSLNYYLFSLQTELEQLKKTQHALEKDYLAIKEQMKTLIEIKQTLDDLNTKLGRIAFSKRNEELTEPTNQQINPTQNPTNPTNESAYDNKTYFKASNIQNLPISTGNKGVPTDRQTNQQTDRQQEKFALNKENLAATNFSSSVNSQNTDSITKIQQVSEILGSLDSIKKEIRNQFKKLTSQEMHIFSLIYQLDDQGLKPDYTLLSNKTNLSESSIRDYVQKLLKKGVPIIKIKENNKKISLSISPQFKRIIPLSTLIALRNL